MASLQSLMKNHPPEGWIYDDYREAYIHRKTGKRVTAEQIEDEIVTYWDMRNIEEHASGKTKVAPRPLPGHVPNTPIKPNMMQVFATSHQCFPFYTQILNEIREGRPGNGWFPTKDNPVKVVPAVAMSRTMFQYFWDASFVDRNSNNTKSLNEGRTVEEMFTPKPIPKDCLLFNIVYEGLGEVQIGLDARLEDWQARASFDPKGEELIAIVDNRKIEGFTNEVFREEK